VPCDDLREDLSTGFDNGTATVTPLGDFDDDWQLVVDASGAPVPSSPTVVSAYPGWLPAFVGSGWLSNAEDGSAAHRALFTSAGIYTYERCWCMSGYAIDPLLGLLARGDNEITDVRLNGVSLVPVAGTIGAFNDAQPMEYEVTDSTMFLPGENCVQVDLDNWGSVAGLNVSGSIFADDGACCEITPAGDDADSP